MGLLKQYKDILEDFVERYMRNNPKVRYSPPSFVIGGANVAGLAMAAGRSTEEYSVARESMPNLAENRRNKTGDNLLKIDMTSGNSSGNNTQKNNNLDYRKPYRQLYAKLYDKIYGIKKRTQQIYRAESSKLKSFYSGRLPIVLRRLLYNPFKKTEPKTGNVPTYSNKSTPNYTLLHVQKYSTQTVIGYNTRKGSLEEIVQAA